VKDQLDYTFPSNRENVLLWYHSTSQSLVKYRPHHKHMMPLSSTSASISKPEKNFHWVKHVKGITVSCSLILKGDATGSATRIRRLAGWYSSFSSSSETKFDNNPLYHKPRIIIFHMERRHGEIDSKETHETKPSR
jgi:hypothetical protein